jgi:hypothetical protein
MNDLGRALDELVVDAPVARASWEDVRRRVRRSRQRTIITAVGVAVVGVAIAAPAVAIGGQRLGLFGGGTPVAADVLSSYNLHVIGAMANGTSPRVPASKREDLDRFSASSLRQIAERDGHAFFVARRRTGGLCVSVGVVGSARVLGSIVCSPDFPSRSMPILDQSTFGGSPQLLSLIRLEGFAADGVAAVGILSTSDTVEAQTAVQDNVYSRTEGLPTEGAAGIVALDRNGDRLYVQCYARSGCKGNG